MTSSSNLFEDNSVKIIVVRDKIESQDNVESNTEVNDFQEEDTSGTNQTLSPSPSSNLFENNNENIQLQKNVENNNTDIDQQDETTTEFQVNNDNNTII
jgi:hypothetical protein